MNFVALFEKLDSTTKTSVKVDAIYSYLQEAAEPDKLLTLAVLMGYKPKRPVKTSDLRTWAAQLAGVPLWLLEESYYIVGDLAETLSLLLPKKAASETFDLPALIVHIKAMQKLDLEQQREAIEYYWGRFSGTSLFLFNKLLTGNFRVGVSRKLVIKALSRYLELDEAVVEHKLMGAWDPFEETIVGLFQEGVLDEKHFLPYPFYLAYAVDEAFFANESIQDWYLEPKLDGIRGQLIVRNGDLFVWSRGEDLLTEKFVEFKDLPATLPHGTVLDGEILPWKDGVPLDFQLMQTRIGRKKLTKRTLEEVPLVMVCYDILEWQGIDLRPKPLRYRRSLLEQVLSEFKLSSVLKLSQLKEFSNWSEADVFRQNARSMYAEGLMIKHKESIYEAGRKRGNWWKWKTDPMTVDGVLIYAQSGHGRRANLFTDYTFAVWDDGVLVPFTKAYSGLTDKELVQIDNWIKKNTIAKYGPVRSVKAALVFELAFEGINLSARHKSGVALRFPRILRWRQDKTIEEANSKQDLLTLINS